MKPNTNAASLSLIKPRSTTNVLPNEQQICFTTSLMDVIRQVSRVKICIDATQHCLAPAEWRSYLQSPGLYPSALPQTPPRLQRTPCCRKFKWETCSCM